MDQRMVSPVSLLRGMGVPRQCTELPCFQCGNCITGLDLNNLNGPVSSLAVAASPALLTVSVLPVGCPVKVR